MLTGGFPGKARNYENGWDILHQATIDDYRTSPLLPNGPVYGPVMYRHNPEGANVAFYDGHVNHLRKEEIYIKEDFCKNPGMWVVNLGNYRSSRPECKP